MWFINYKINILEILRDCRPDLSLSENPAGQAFND